ncbi:DoxX family protein, partial [Kineococcus glutinatus]|uniref:DoxX family protein n=1 Tax=Kineococcus glutinatus TaxID=1070872 RepID=UPI0031F0A387
MTLVRRVARPLIAGYFVACGVDQLRRARELAPQAEPVAGAVAGPLGLPDDPELLVRVNGAAMAGAGALFALGRAPRLSALVLAATMAPATASAHPFWSAAGDERARELRAFLKSASLVGAALLEARDTAGCPGVGWRGRRLAHDAVRAG